MPERRFPAAAHESTQERDMFTEKFSCPAGARQMRHLKRGAALVALRGRLRVSHRDAALDWLTAAAPTLTVVLDEGECHVLADDAYVEWAAENGPAECGVIDAPPARWRVWVANWIGRWPGPRGLAGASAHGPRDSLG
jgi:hypothetical protein